MRRILVYVAAFAAFAVEAYMLPLLGLPPWGMVLAASAYGAAVGWGLMRTKDR